MNLFTEVDQVDSVLSADGWRPARRAENSTAGREQAHRREGQKQGEDLSLVISHLSFVISEIRSVPPAVAGGLV